MRLDVFRILIVFVHPSDETDFFSRLLSIWLFCNHKQTTLEVIFLKPKLSFSILFHVGEHLNEIIFLVHIYCLGCVFEHACTCKYLHILPHIHISL